MERPAISLGEGAHHRGRRDLEHAPSTWTGEPLATTDSPCEKWRARHSLDSDRCAARFRSVRCRLEVKIAVAQTRGTPWVHSRTCAQRQGQGSTIFGDGVCARDMQRMRSLFLTHVRFHMHVMSYQKVSRSTRSAGHSGGGSPQATDPHALLSSALSTAMPPRWQPTRRARSRTHPRQSTGLR